MRKINKNNLIWLIILIGFLCYFVYLVYTKKYLLFVHPRAYKFIIFGIVLFALISIRQLTSLFAASKSQAFKPGYLLFFLTLILAFLVNTHNISANISATRTLNIPNSKNSVQNANQDSIPVDSKVCTQDNHNHSLYETETTKYIIKDNKVELNDANLSYALKDMYTYPKRYENKSVTITGFVFRDKDSNTSEFAVARLLMSCCTADTSVVGLMANIDNAQKYMSNTWVTVAGKIKIKKAIRLKTHTNTPIPYIDVTNIKIIDTPDSQYIY